MNNKGRRNGWTNPLIPIYFLSKNHPLFSLVAASDIGSAKDRRSMLQCGRPNGGANRRRQLRLEMQKE
jgi:hypothetical protein